MARSAFTRVRPALRALRRISATPRRACEANLCATAVESDALVGTVDEDSSRERSAIPERPSLMLEASATESVLKEPVEDAPVSPFHRQEDGTLNLEWQRGSDLGEGGFGLVFRARVAGTGRIIAVKESRETSDDTEEFRYHDKLRQELEIHRDLRHPNIVRCFGCDYKIGRLYIYMEFMSAGSLRSHLDQYGACDLQTLRRGLHQILCGVDFLHTREPPIVHRDLKGQNILVDDRFNLKLADFGCSKRSDDTFATLVGTAFFTAPEVFEGKGYQCTVDIWSVGCVTIEMASAQNPWHGQFENNMGGYLALVRTMLTRPESRPEIPEWLPEEGKALAEHCLRRKPEDRPSAAELLDFEFSTA